MKRHLLFPLLTVFIAATAAGQRVNDPDEIFVATYYVGPAFFHDDPVLQKATDAHLHDVRENLAKRGIRSTNQSAAYYLPATCRLVVANTSAQLDLFEELVQTDTDHGSFRLQPMRGRATNSPGHGEALTWRELKVPSGYFDGKLKLDAGTGTKSLHVEAVFESEGVIFAPGHSATYLPLEHKLIVVNDPLQIELINELLSGFQAAKGRPTVR